MTEKELKNRLLLAGLIVVVITIVGLLMWTRVFSGNRNLAGELLEFIVLAVAFVGYGIYTVRGFLQDRCVPKESPSSKPVELLSDKTCPSCGRRLRKNQVDNMIGDELYQEWCRKGFCSLKCFEKKKEPTQAVETTS
jgi:hypothetical protein